MPKFHELGLSEETLKVLEKKGFEEYTPIQGKVIPTFLNSDLDIIGQAQTGTGKTAAFGLPLIELIDEKKNFPQALVLVPTRELALQVAEEINSLTGKRKIQVVPIYGGQSISEQLRRLKAGAHIVVGTPGRVIDHLERRSLKLEAISYFVLDEADEMLNMGFIDDVEEILENTNEEKRVLLFSATMPKKLMAIADKYMGKKEIIKIESNQLTTQLTNQIYFEVSARDKFEALCRIIDIEPEFYGMIFCRTKIDVDQVAHALVARGYAADGLHGDISQFHREKLLGKFKQKTLNILVATDVAARGIDINNLTHVINYSLPQNPESYVHRIGRTGRAGKQGTAINFVTPDEYRKLVFIQRITKTPIRKEKLPRVQDVIQIKLNKLQKDIQHLIDSESHTPYLEIAQKFSGLGEADDIIAALMKHCFRHELDIKAYTEIQETSVDKQGKTRLFVALGKKDGMTPIKLEQVLQQKTNINSLRIKNAEIFDRFSFINTSFEDAELILDTFKKIKGRALVTRAKKRKEF